jgi:hypothetical protein
MRREELLLEGEDAEEAVEGAAHAGQAAFAPRPHLRCDQVHNGDAELFQPARQAEVEVWGIGEDGEIGAAAAHFGEELAIFAVDAGDMGDDFEEADDGEAGGIDDGLDAGLAHAGAGAAEQARVGPEAAEFGGEERGVKIAGGLPGGDQDGAGHSTCRIAGAAAISGAPRYYGCVTETEPTPHDNPGALDILSELYVFRDYRAVCSYFEKQRNLLPVLIEAHCRISATFGKSVAPVLSIVREPTAPESVELFALIPTTLPIETALQYLAKFDEEWWLDAAEHQQARLNFDIEFV